MESKASRKEKEPNSLFGILERKKLLKELEILRREESVNDELSLQDKSKILKTKQTGKARK